MAIAVPDELQESEEAGTDELQKRERPCQMNCKKARDRGQMIFRRARGRDLHLRRPCRNARLPLGFAYLGIKIFSCLEDITDAADQRFVVESGAVGESAVRDVDEAVAVAGAEAVVSK